MMSSIDNFSAEKFKRKGEKRLSHAPKAASKQEMLFKNTKKKH